MQKEQSSVRGWRCFNLFGLDSPLFAASNSHKVDEARSANPPGLVVDTRLRRIVLKNAVSGYVDTNSFT